MSILSNMGFRENLKNELTYRDMRVKELAEKAGVSKRVIDHYLAEKCTSPQAETAVKIAAALGVSVEYLVTGKDAAVPDSIKPEIVAMLSDLNHLAAEDIAFIRLMIKRLQR